MAFAPPTYLVLITGCLVVTALLQFVSSAANAIASGIARHHAMSGQVSTAMNVALQLPAAMAALLGGVLAGLLEGSAAETAARTIFLIGAALMLVLAAFGVLGPKRLFEDAGREPPALSPGQDALRLLKTWAIYPALVIQILWQFGPGVGVALQYHLSNDIHATDAQIGGFYAIFNLGFLPTYLLYGWLAQRVSLRPLVWLGAALAIPQMVSLLFIHSPGDVLLAAIPMGILGGIGQCAFMDLAIRSCPKGLEGTMMMMLWSMYWIAVTFGDLWGADLYEHHGGFNTALMATIAVYAAILPIVLLIPRRITAGKDA
jgi:MFS family permease